MLGALVSAGVPFELLQEAAGALGIGAEIRVHSVERGGIRAMKVDVLENGVLAETDMFTIATRTSMTMRMVMDTLITNTRLGSTRIGMCMGGGGRRFGS